MLNINNNNNNDDFTYIKLFLENTLDFAEQVQIQIHITCIKNAAMMILLISNFSLKIHLILLNRCKYKYT